MSELTCLLICPVFQVLGIYLGDVWGPVCPTPPYPGPLPIVLSSIAPITEDQITFKALTLDQTLVLVDENTNWNNINCGTKLLFIFPGNGETIAKPYVQKLCNASVVTNQICCILVDYTYTATSDIALVYPRGDVSVIGDKVTTMMEKVFVPGGILLQNIDFYGFSFGCHASGVSGYKISTTLGSKIGVLTCSDPERGLELAAAPDRLSPESANCVVAHHCSCYIASMLKIYAPVNYWWGQCGENQYPISKGNCILNSVTCHDYYVNEFINKGHYKARLCSQCPYASPQNSFSVTYGQSTYCTSTNEPVLRNQNNCNAGDYYVLPTDCVPPNL